MKKIDARRIPGILTPLIVASAIIVSFRYQKDAAPLDIQGAEPPPKPIAAVEYALEQAFAPGAPGYTWGSKNAPVTVLELSDFGCPYSGAFARETLPQLMKDYVDAGLVRWKYVPFVLGMFSNGTDAARAAECAGEQGTKAFKSMHDQLFATQDEWKSAADPGIFKSYARAAKLDVASFGRCYDTNEAEKRIHASNRLAEDLGVGATPTFFINGARLDGALPLEKFRQILDEAVRVSRVN